MNILVVVLTQVSAIFFIREVLCEDIMLITHKRIFRHKLKKKIPFIRRLLLLNYIEVFKKKWMWHYVCFVFQILISILTMIFAIVLDILSIWHDVEPMEIIFYGTILCGILNSLMVGIFSTRWNREGHSVRRKK